MKSTSKKHQFTELVEETGLTCNICREGYKSDPKKVISSKSSNQIAVFDCDVIGCLVSTRTREDALSKSLRVKGGNSRDTRLFLTSTSSIMTVIQLRSVPGHIWSTSTDFEVVL